MEDVSFYSMRNPEFLPVKLADALRLFYLSREP